MRSSTGDDAGACIPHLLEEERELQSRLQRVTVALALCEEVLGDAFDRIANRQAAARARRTAEECRAFAARLRTL
jgi:hypothetical protein